MGNYQPTSSVWRNGFSTGLNMNMQFSNAGKWQIPVIMYPTGGGQTLEPGFCPIELALYEVNVQFASFSEYKPNN